MKFSSITAILAGLLQVKARTSPNFNNSIIVYPPPADTLNFVLLNSLDSNTTLEQRSESSFQHKTKLFNIHSLEDMKHPQRGQLMTDKSRQFYFQKENTGLYYDETAETWFLYEMSQTEMPTVGQFPMKIPVSSCMDSSFGSGESFSRTYSVEVDISRSVTFETSYNVSTIVVGALLGYAVESSMVFSGTITCSIDKGQYGQMFIVPYAVEVPPSRRRRAIYEVFRGVVADGKSWERFSAFKLIAKTRPSHVCQVTDNIRELDCAGVIGGKKE